MDFKVINAIEKAINSPVWAWFPLSELPRNPIMGKNVEMIGENKFRTVWFADGECYDHFQSDEANKIKDEMCQELEEMLQSRNLKTRISGQVVQEFTWNHQKYDLNNHGVNWLVVLEGEILEKVGTIYKNHSDHQSQMLDDKLAEFQKDLIESLTLGC